MRIFLFAALMLPCSLVWSQGSAHHLTLEYAVKAALAADPWLVGSEQREQSLVDEAVFAETLPDPKVSVIAGNFPTDSFDINQEPMTQIGLGISQVFPRGESRALGRQQKEQLSSQEPLLREDRQAQVRATVSRLWLEVYRSQESIALIASSRALFEYLVEASRASYASALGRARQQDLIRAQLELTRLEDRLSALQQQHAMARQRLSEWIGAAADLPLAGALPAEPISTALPSAMTAHADGSRLWGVLESHPALLAVDKRIEASHTGIELAKQQYQPEWGLSAQYGYRDEDLMGRSRADLLTVGVTFDLPLFTGNRQDRSVSAAVARTEAQRTEKALLQRRMLAELNTALTQLQFLDERNRRYTDELLPQMAEQAEAALNAYNNDEGDFAEAVRARIAELDAKLAALSLAVDREQVLATLNYFLAGEPLASSSVEQTTTGDRS